MSASCSNWPVKDSAETLLPLHPGTEPVLEIQMGGKWCDSDGSSTELATSEWEG